MCPRFFGAMAWLVLALSARPESADQIFQNAARLFQQRELTAARREFLRLVQTTAPAPKARYYLGRIALLESKPAEAVEWLEPIAASDPPVFDSAAQLSKAYLDAGQIEKAKAMTERAVRFAEWDGALHYRLGRIYQQMGNADESRKEFAESVRLKAADRASVELLLQCSQQLTNGAIEEAMRIREEMLGNRSLDPDVLVALGLTFTGAGRQAESLDLFETAARRDPNFFQAQFNSGVTLIKLGRAAEAIPFLEAAQHLAPDSAEANSALALSYVLQKRYADSFAPLEKWRGLQPENPRVLNMLGLAYLRTNAASKAILVLRTAVRVSRDDPKPYFLLVEALNASEQQTAALETADQALKLFPSLAQAHVAKAQQLARLGRYREAGPLFARALELAPGQIDSLLGLAEAQQKQGEYAVSLETYQRALGIEPKNITASLGASRDMVLLNRLGDARRLLEEALAAHPDSPQLHYDLSRVYARLGEPQLAAEQTQILQDLRARETKVPQ